MRLGERRPSFEDWRRLNIPQPNPIHIMDEDRLRDFYERNPPDLRFITDINRRHFRFLLPNGRFFKVKDAIRSPADLQSWLVKLQPSDVYYSTSTFLDPT